MPSMHIDKRYVVPLLALVASVVILVANQFSTEPPTAGQIFEKSRALFSTATSYQLEVIDYSLTSTEPQNTIRLQFVRPDIVKLLDSEGETITLTSGHTVYARSEELGGKWFSRSDIEYSQLGLFNPFFPLELFEPELVETTDDYYVIDGWARRTNSSDSYTSIVNRVRLKVASKNFAIVEQAWRSTFADPFGTVDENGNVEINSAIDVSEEYSSRRTVFAYSSFGENFDVAPPSAEDLVIEVIRTWPSDDNLVSNLAESVGFWISDGVEVMDLTIEPHIELEKSDPPQESPSRGYGFKWYKPVPWFEKQTTYTATLTYGDPDANLRTESWSFTTR